MAQIRIDLSEYDYQMFKYVIGDGNMSSAIRNFIKATIGNQETYKNEITKRKRLKILEEDKTKLDAQYSKLKAEIDAIDEDRKLKEIQRLDEIEKEKQKMRKLEGDTLRANLSEMV